MTRRALLFLAAAQLLRAETHPIPAISAALQRLYNFDFAGAHKLLDAFIAENPAHPLGYTFRAAVFLFHELDRLGVLEAEFLTDDKKITSDEKREPDAAIKAAFDEAVAKAQRLAGTQNPQDTSALFALCVAEGMVTDYKAFVEKRRWASFSHARQSHNYALDLLRRDPRFVDALLTTGLTEYLLGSLPFFIRWFVRFPQTQGSKQKAIENLQRLSKEGLYLGPFARILLAIIYLREKRPQDSIKTLEMLANEFPENPLIKKELGKVREKFPPPAIQPRR
jgi:predicted Zn-dependent protease